ncbi:MAG: hypothetical protein WBG50_00005 [Desulfomonilaceae bacterium]
MSEFQVMVGAAIASFLFFLIGPAAVWRITKGVAEFLLIILVFIWAI